MARINLLPWRQEQREKRNNEFNILIVGTIVLAAICTFIGYSVLNNTLNNQRDANKRVEDANAQLEAKLNTIKELEAQREQMLSQMKVIQDLQGRRSIPVRVWDDMARAVPSAMYLTSIKRENDLITITGQADNANVVAALVRNLNSSQWLDGSAVVSIKSKLQAYQEPQTAQNTQANSQNPNGEPSRPMYPEDNYVEFVVTTQVQNPQEQQNDATGEQAVMMPGTTPADPSSPSGFDPSLAAPIGVDNAPAVNGAAPATNAPADPNAAAQPAQPAQPAPSPAPAANNPPPVQGTTAPAGGQ